MNVIVQNVTALPERMKRELIRGEHARAEFAIRAQTALAEAMGERGPSRYLKGGLGRHVTTIHPELAARVRVKYGSRCLHDPDFLRALVRDNPFLRVQCVPAALTLRVDGLRDRRSEVGGRTENSRRPELRPQSSQITQIRRGDGATGDPGTASARARERGSSSLLVPRARGSAHEIPSGGSRRQSANSADRESITSRSTITITKGAAV